MRNLLKDLAALLRPYKKAIVAGLAAAIVAALPLVLDGDVTKADVSYIVGAFISGAGITYKVRNGEITVGTRRAE